MLICLKLPGRVGTCNKGCSCFVFSYPHNTNSTKPYISADTGPPGLRLRIVCMLSGEEWLVSSCYPPEASLNLLLTGHH